MGPNAPFADEGDELVMGTVTWRRLPSPLGDGWYAIYLIDKRFVALFPRIDVPVEDHLRPAGAPVALSDLLVGMVYIGPDRQVFLGPAPVRMTQSPSISCRSSALVWA